jgi:hypothetical protein
VWKTENFPRLSIFSKLVRRIHENRLPAIPVQATRGENA